MNHATTCKFCKKKMVLQIDDYYAELGDPQHIIPRAACDRCADLHELKRLLTDQIIKICVHLTRMSGQARVKAAATYRDAMERLTKRYSRMIAEWVGSTTPFWDSACVDLILERPDAAGQVLTQLWKGYTQR